MHLIDTVTGHDDVVLQCVRRPPFGPGIHPEELVGAVKLEVWGSDVGEPGPDYCLFKVFDDHGVIAEQKAEGY